MLTKLLEQKCSKEIKTTKRQQTLYLTENQVLLKSLLDFQQVNLDCYRMQRLPHFFNLNDSNLLLLFVYFVQGDVKVSLKALCDALLSWFSCSASLGHVLSVLCFLFQRPSSGDLY